MNKNVKLGLAALIGFAGYKLLTHKPTANPAASTSPSGQGGGYGVGGPSPIVGRGSQTYGFQAMGRSAAGSRGDSNGF